MDINNTIPDIITGQYYKDLICPLNAHSFKQCMTQEHTEKELAPFFALNHTKLTWEDGIDMQMSLPKYLDTIMARGYAARKTISIWEPAKLDGFMVYFGEEVDTSKRLTVGYSVNFGQKLESMSLINTLLISNATLFLEPYLPSSKILTTSIDESHQVVASIKQIFYDKLNVELKQSPKGDLYLSQSCTDLDIFYQPITLLFEGNKSISLNLQNMFIQDGANCKLQLLIVAAAPSIQVQLNSKAFIEIGVTFDLEKDTVSFSGGFEPKKEVDQNDGKLMIIGLVIAGVVIVLGGIIIVIKRRQGLKKDLITYQSI